MVNGHAVELSLRPSLAMERGSKRLVQLTTDVRHSTEPGCHRYNGAPSLGAARQRIQRSIRHDVLLTDVLGVDQRTLSCHRNRFFDRPDRQFGINGRREPRCQYDPITL